MNEKEDAVWNTQRWVEKEIQQTHVCAHTYTQSESKHIYMLYVCGSEYMLTLGSSNPT